MPKTRSSPKKIAKVYRGWLPLHIERLLPVLRSRDGSKASVTALAVCGAIFISVLLPGSAHADGPTMQIWERAPFYSFPCFESKYFLGYLNPGYYPVTEQEKSFGTYSLGVTQGYRNRWWLSSWKDNRYRWVNAVYVSGGYNYSPIPGIIRNLIRWNCN